MHFYRLKTESNLDSNIATEAYFYIKPEIPGQLPDDPPPDPFILSISVNEKNGDITNPAGPSVTRFGEAYGYDQWAGLNWVKWMEVPADQIPQAVANHTVANKLAHTGYIVWNLADITAEMHVYDEANARLERRYNVTDASMRSRGIAMSWVSLALLLLVTLLLLVALFGVTVRPGL